ncbi:MAG: hypothetical protein R6U25_06635 [Alkalispirochaeta sp.]
MTKEALHTELSAARTATHSVIDAADEATRSRVPAGHTWSALMVLDHLRILDEQVAAVDCRDRRFPHPWIGPMNAYEWLLFTAVHERGHHAHLRAILAEAEACKFELGRGTDMQRRGREDAQSAFAYVKQQDLKGGWVVDNETVDTGHGRIEIRDCFHTDKIAWSVENNLH